MVHLPDGSRNVARSTVVQFSSHHIHVVECPSRSPELNQVESLTRHVNCC